MASSSTSSVAKSFKYDVFLSFRGEDTRHTFVAHLHSALKRESIITYKDDEDITRGERISDELIGAIENSRFYVIVFSKNYASSSWCLDELAKIMECQESSEHKAYPIFYHVEATQVRNQSGAFGEAFEKNKMKEDAGKWRKALNEAAGLAGFGLKDNIRDEAKFINEVVEKILQELPSIKFSDVEKFIGMEARVEEIISSSNIGSSEVHMIGIKGMGGAGKTTLAKAIYDKFSHHFGNKSFVENVREKVSKDSSGLKSLQEQVLSDMSKGKITINGESDGKLQIKKRMCDKEVLLVLDDVDDTKQLEALAEPSWFRPGSIIVITTRDEGVLIKHRVNSVHDVNLLSSEEAICLFSWHAFRTDVPISGYEKLSQQVVDYAAGLPLTIKVLGSDLVGKHKLEWEETIKSLKQIPPKETLQQLELSYMGLEADYKIIFLDVACFWKGCLKEEAIIPLQSCQSRAIIGLKVLERKSLITISTHGSLEMHDSIQEMGWDIVRRDHRDEPERHSRLWIREEIEYILANDLGNESTRGIQLIGLKLSPSIIMKGLKKMKKLRFLYVNSYRLMDFSDGDFDEANGYLPSTLQYLCWHSYPFTSLPIATFQESNLSGLGMIDSNLVQLWQGGKRKALKKLRFFNFRGSYLKTLDLGFSPNLETLRIQCNYLEKLHMPAKFPKLKSLTIDCLRRTVHHPGWGPSRHPMSRIPLSLERCDESIAGRMVIESPSLQSLDLYNVNLKTINLGMIPYLESITLHAVNLGNLNLEECSQLREITINSCSQLITLDLGLSPNLKNLYLEDCSDLVQVCMHVGYPRLRFLTLRHLPKLRTLDTAMTPNLEILDAKGCEQLELQMPLKCPKLEILDLSGSMQKTLRLQTSNLEDLHLEGCSYLLELHMLDECPKLKIFSISCSKLRTFNVAQTPNLEELSLKGCEQLELQMPLKCSKLETLHLSGSMQKTIGLQTPNLEELNIKKCSDLLELHMLDECPKLETLDLSGSTLKTLKLKTPNLEKLLLEECSNLLELHMLDECPKLERLSISCSKLRTFNLAQAPNLKVLNLEDCDQLQLQMPLKSSNLKTLVLSGSMQKTLELQTPNLEKLLLEECSNLLELHLLDECPKLEMLSISYSKLRTCNLAQALNLEELYLKECDQLELQMPLKFPNLKTLDLSGSMQKTLELQTPNLKKLYLKECSNLLETHMLDECPKLNILSIISCSKLSTPNLVQAPNLEELALVECDQFELQMPLKCPKLKTLHLSSSMQKTLELQTPDLENLYLRECKQLELQLPLQYPKLKTLILRGSIQKAVRLQTPNLEKLRLEECSNLMELHMLDECTKLERLSISCSKLRTFNLAQTPNLEDLILRECYNLAELHAPITCLGNIRKLYLSGGSRFKTFDFPNKFEDSEVDVFPELKVIVESVDTSDNNFPEFRFECYYDERPLWTGNLEKLISVISTCLDLESFYKSICDLQGLRKLELIGDIPEFPNNLCWSGHLEEVTISSKDIKHIPDSICMLKHLKYLKVESCWHLEKLPQDLGQLECLETLSLFECIFLGDIPKSICQMKCLKYLHLSYCLSLNELPEEFGHLASLKELRVEGTSGIRHLPQSILRLQGLIIAGSNWLLRSWGLTPQIKISGCVSECRI